MAADVEGVVTVAMSEQQRLRASARAMDLNMALDEYVSMVLAICDQLPVNLLFCLSSGIPVKFEASAYIGGDMVE